MLCVVCCASVFIHPPFCPLKNRDFLALNVYVALCYYKLDYYDVSQEVLAVYLQVCRWIETK